MDQPRVVQLPAAINVAARFANTDRMRLYKSTYVPVPGTTLGDLTANEVLFDGYAPRVMPGVWQVGLDANGHGQAIYGGLVTFVQSGIVTTDSAGGYWIEDAATTMVKQIGSFASPMPFNLNGNQLLVKPVQLNDVTESNDAELIYGP
jgi:hypothetical protein